MPWQRLWVGTRALGSCVFLPLVCTRGHLSGSEDVWVPASLLSNLPRHKSQVISLNAPPAGDVGS